MANPKSRKPLFQHSSLDLSRKSIRLITILPKQDDDLIRCQVHHEITAQARYTAVSYEWQGRVGTIPILMNGKTFYVTQNLYDFLQVARRAGDSIRFWIDALCIDQYHADERRHQVRQMDEVYSGARQVWVWLGGLQGIEAFRNCPGIFNLNGFAHTHSLALSKRELARIKLRNWELKGYTEWLQALKEVCQRSYWTRLWIVQEFLKARSITIFVGNRSFSAEDFAALVLEATNEDQTYPSIHEQDKIKKYTCWKLCQRRYGTHSSSRCATPTLSGREESLTDVLWDYGHCGCSDWRDKVFGLLSLVENGEKFPISYIVSKTELIKSVIVFEGLKDMREVVPLVEFLQKLLHVPQASFLLCLPERGGQLQEQDTVTLSRYATVERATVGNLGHWYLKRGRRGSHPIRRIETVNTCDCSSCQFRLLPTMRPGDEIFEMVPQGREYRIFFAFRWIQGKINYVGALIAGYGERELWIHALPQPAMFYNMCEHILSCSLEEGVIVLNRDLPTSAFLDSYFEESFPDLSRKDEVESLSQTDTLSPLVGNGAFASVVMQPLMV